MPLVNANNILPESFYEQDTRFVASQLLGKYLCRRTKDGLLTGMIVETEAYLHDDPASHSYMGKRPRNAPMFGAAGRTYVYLSYGVHDMLNIVTAANGVGEGVLIRAVYPVDGIELMRQNRNKPDGPMHRLAAGPGCVAQAFAISRSADNGADVTRTDSGIWICNGEAIPPEQIVRTTRIGITKAPDKPWRYYIAGNLALSKKAN
jgi:DNA-3-methyladenine glycosylase